ncbi:porin [Sphingopyxis sp. OAS728]|uniref:carbohydrate porin n=1 Tax=Sphingopyxis sp. OAS728 TaxID=2663823 RepID=UPI001A0E48CA|nr:carbohydrate porin [Sphingopyxis sp. OAS728]MBE1529953.1 porin [Sphingopyxis sp. OAS728]
MLLSALMLAAAGEEVTLPPPHGHLPHAHTHAPAEIDETHGPVLLQATYTAEVIGNASGGLKRGTRYLDNFDLVLEADMEALVGWNGAQLHVYGLYNNGKSISDLVGDAQAVSNIETGTSALRLYEAWVDQKLGEHVSVRAGLYDLNSEFDALDAAGLFVSSPHGIGTDFAQSGQNGPSIFPSTSLAARLAVTPAEGWTVRAAVLDGVPGDPAHPGRTAVKLGHADGALLVGELEAPLGEGKLLLGHWRYTADFERNDGNAAGDGNAGTYVRAEVPLIERSGRRVDAFARLGTASGRYNMFDRFASGGLKFSGWVPGREADEFGIAFAAAFTSDSWRAATSAASAEVAVEATYRAQVAPWLAVQPNIHYIHRPSADRAITDALVIGLRAEASFSLLGF